jgi:hypothetical protein
MSNERRDESGATLILALLFVIVTGVVGVALASLTSTNLTATSSFQTKRGLELAADGAVDAAIQNVRYSGTSYTSPTQCFPIPGNSFSLNGATLYVECSAGSAPLPSGETGRSVQFVACAVAQSSCPAVDTDLTAQVTFDDYSDSGVSATGTSVTIVSWIDTA